MSFPHADASITAIQSGEHDGRLSDIRRALEAREREIADEAKGAFILAARAYHATRDKGVYAAYAAETVRTFAKDNDAQR
jgi:hypothetical protein